MRLLIQLCAAFTLMTGVMAARTLSVGPGRPYAKPCEAVGQAVSGDVIEIDAGIYSGDVCAILLNNLTLRGVGGRPRIEAAGNYAWGKGTWVIAGENTIIENIEFTGAAVPGGGGAAVRLDTGNLTVRNCYFHHNENGILGGSYGNVFVEHSEFAYNGEGDSTSHNIYITNGVATFTLQFSYAHNGIAGPLVKSRATTNLIRHNRLTEEGGGGSYELDLPNGGLGYVIGNIFQQDNATGNPAMLSFGMEGISSSIPVHQLFVVNNTFVNSRPAGGTFVQIGGGQPAVLRNNIFAGPGVLTYQAAAQLSGNVVGGVDMGFANAAGYDYRLTPFSPALNAGVDPGAGLNNFALRPVSEYRHPMCEAPRGDVGIIDSGAYEYGNLSAGQNCGAVPEPVHFADVSPTDPFLPAIELMRDKGITNGCGANPPQYCPQDNVRRGEMAVFLVRAAMGGDTFSYNPSPYFDDVPTTHRFYKWIQKLSELGITNGCDVRKYCPEDAVSRGQMAAFIIRARLGPKEQFDSPATPLFADVPAQHVFFASIQKMKQIGITSGCSGNEYCPESLVTRGQMAVFVMRGLFNQFLPAATPILTSITIVSGGQATAVDVTVTGRGTNFQSGATTLRAGQGITVSQLVVVNATTLNLRLSIASNAEQGPRPLTAVTGAEEATLPNGFTVR